jgi:hypothetical protein
MDKMNFNINDLVYFQIFKPKNFFMDLFSHPGVEYSYFRTDKPIKPDIIVRIGKFKPKNNDCFIIDSKYYIKKDYIYYKDSHKIAKWEVEVSGFERDLIEINVDCNAFGYIFFESILQFFISFILCKKGYALIHSSAIEKDGKAYFFPARSGAGKTISSVYFTQEGYNFLGDNFTILHKKKIISFPTPLLIFRHNLKEPIRKVLSKKYRALIFLKYLLYRLTLKYAKFYTPVPVEFILKDKIKKEADLKSLILLINGKGFSERKIETKSVIDKLVSIDKFEFLNLNTVFISYSFLFPKANLANYWDKLRNNIKEGLDNVTSYQVTVPVNYTHSVFEKIHDIVKRL